MEQSQASTPAPPEGSCPNGHPWSAETLRYSKRGSRYCRTCKNEATRRSHRRRIERGGVQTQGRPRYVLGGVCQKGHPLTEANAYIHQGVTRCRTCRAIWSRNYQRNQDQANAELRQQAGHTDHYSPLPKIELFYSAEDLSWVARFRNTATLDGLSGLGNGALGALVELAHAYSAAHDQPHMSNNLLAINDRFWEVPDGQV